MSPAAASPIPSGTVTLMFTDVEGSTRLWEAEPDPMAQALRRHDEMLRAAISRAGGFVFKTAGDAFCAAFASPQASLDAALAAQKALAAEPWPTSQPIRVRMSLHTGVCEERDNDYFGPVVNRAARLGTVAHGGQVLVSGATAELLSEALPEGVGLRDLGAHRLKDLGRPEHVFQLEAGCLPSGFPALGTLDNPELPNNLPGLLSAFVGREREVDEVGALVGSNRLVTLTGAGGCGKTRLALQAAAEVLDGAGDGVWFVELAPLAESGKIPEAVAAALGLADDGGRQPRSASLSDVLREQDTLILLDNCEHLIDGAAKFCGQILRDCPRLRILATSREPLGLDGEHVYRVPSLSLPPGEAEAVDDIAAADAVRLFVDRARAHHSGFVLDETSAPVVASVCRRLDGIPLALELAAARLSSMSIRQVSERLGQRFRLLTGGSRNAMPRQQTLQAAVDWSFGLLTQPERDVLRRLSVFAGSFELEAAEVICASGAVDAFDAADLLGSLVSKSLVVADRTARSVRYRMLETIRQYAADRLAEASEDQAAVVAAHCAHYLAAAETAAPHLTGPDQGSWLTRLDADRANFRRAAEHAAGEPDGTSQVLRFGVALWRYWLVRYRKEEAVALLVPALRRPEAAADPALFAEALVAAARVTVDTDLATSIRLAEQADEVAGGLGDARLLVMSRAHLARAYSWAGEPERARALALEAVGRARQLGDDVLLGTCLMAQAHAVGAAASGPLYAEAIACTERSGHIRLSRTLHNNAGCAALEIGDIPAARAHLEAAIRAAATIGEPHPIASGNLGWVLRAEHDHHSARSRFEEALRTSRRIGNNRGMAGAIDGLASLATDLGNWHRAAALHGAGQALLDKTGVQLEALDDRFRQESLGQARAAVGDAQVQRAYARGMALSLGQVIGLALGGALPGT